MFSQRKQKVRSHISPISIPIKTK